MVFIVFGSKNIDSRINKITIPHFTNQIQATQYTTIVSSQCVGFKYSRNVYILSLTCSLLKQNNYYYRNQTNYSY